MGYTMCTERYRYTEWREIKSGKVEARELYDHHNDPDENTNVVDKPENQELVDRLAKILKDGYPAALPPSDGKNQTK